MAHEQAIRQKIASFLRREISLSVLERWIGSEGLEMFRDGSDAEAVRLIAAVNLLVSELHDRVIADVEFHNELSSLLNNVVIEADFIEDQRFAPVVQRLGASQSAEILNPYASPVGYQVRFLRPLAAQLHSRRQQPWNLQYA